MLTSGACDLTLQDLVQGGIGTQVPQRTRPLGLWALTTRPRQVWTKLVLFFGSLSNSVRLEIAIWISGVLTNSGSFSAMPLKPLQYLISGPGSFRVRSIFQVPVASPSYRGRVISPDLVPFPKDVLSSTEGTVTAQSAMELQLPLKGS